MASLKYSQAKIFKFPKKIESLSKTNKEILAPVHVRIKPTNKCNHECYYCSYKSSNLALGGQMSEKEFIGKEKMREIISDLSEIGVKAITLSGGGEPLSYPFIEDLLEQIISTPIKLGIITNGALLSGKIAKLVSRSATWVRISIDGWDEKSYSEYRSVKLEEFSKVLRNITILKRNSSCTIGASIIVDHENVNHLFSLTQQLVNSGVSNVKISPCVVSDSNEYYYNYHASIFNIAKEQIDKIKMFFGKEIELFDSYQTTTNDFQKDYDWCPYLQILPVIGADLRIYSCQDKAYTPNGLIGDIRNQKFSQLWFSSKEKFFMINPKNDCRHHCVADFKNRQILSSISMSSDHDYFV